MPLLDCYKILFSLGQQIFQGYSKKLKFVEWTMDKDDATYLRGLSRMKNLGVHIWNTISFVVHEEMSILTFEYKTLFIFTVFKTNYF